MVFEIFMHFTFLKHPLGQLQEWKHKNIFLTLRKKQNVLILFFLLFCKKRICFVVQYVNCILITKTSVTDMWFNSLSNCYRALPNFLLREKIKKKKIILTNFYKKLFIFSFFTKKPGAGLLNTALNCCRHKKH